MVHINIGPANSIDVYLVINKGVGADRAVIRKGRNFFAGGAIAISERAKRVRCRVV
jgi:hypothetical protein